MEVIKDGTFFFNWQSHIRRVIRDHGQWVGLVDENWQPICDLPAMIDLQATTQRLDPADIQVEIPASHEGVPHLVVDELVAGDLGQFAENGLLVPNLAAARSIVVQRSEYARSRQAFFITHATAEGDGDVPTLLRVHGQDLLGLLAATPCPSVPRTWTGTIKQWTEDAGGKYTTPRTYGAVEMSEVLDGYTVHGKAVTVIRDLIQDSIDAVCKQMGWEQPHMVVDYSEPDVDSPEILIRLNDQSLWDAVAEPARLAGVTISAYLWWPHDSEILTRVHDDIDEINPDHPICVIRVTQSKEV